MGIRQTLNENPALSTAVTGVVILVAVVYLAWHAFGGHSHVTPPDIKFFYSDDDGKTYFVDGSDKVPPFVDSGGKQAVRAMVFKCGDGAPFVAYLMRYGTEEKRPVAGPAADASGNRDPRGLGLGMLEVKKPGAKAWIKMDPKHPQPYVDTMIVSCPDGSKTGLQPVFPAR